MVAVGAVTDSSARIWLRSRTRSPLELRLWPLSDPAREFRQPVAAVPSESSDHTMSFAYPEDFGSAPPLSPLTRYGFRILHSEDGTGGGEGRFRTAPRDHADTPERFSFAFMSCHQPYDDDGDVDDRALRMLRLLEPVLESHDVKYVLMVGDQMYSDYPRKRSLFDPSYLRSIRADGQGDILALPEKEILWHYHQRYRIAWSLPEFTGFQTRYPTYCMLDDHEIVDNWGSSRRFLEPAWQKLGRAARKAFFDYQGSRTLPAGPELPGSFHYDFRYGNTATFVSDMRSQRRSRNSSNQIFGEDQFRDIERFLEENEDRGALFLVLTVPMLYVPDWMARLGVRILGEGTDVSDRWGWRDNTRDRDRLLSLLRRQRERNPRQRLVLLSGDIHVGMAMVMCWDDAAHSTIYQFVSSALTNTLDPLEYLAAKVAAHAMPKLHHDGHDLAIEFVEPRGEGKNPFSGLNLGIVEVRSHRDHATVRFRLISHARGNSEGAVVALDTGEL